MEPIFLRVEAFKAGAPKKSFIAFSNLEDEFLDKTKSDRKQIVAKIARGDIYREGKITYGPSTRRHLFGTDPLGRDLLTRVLIGGRISLAVGFAATIVSVIIGVLWGATAGFLGGKVDNLMMRIVDILYALPFTVIVILLMVMFGRNFILLFVAIGAVEWLTIARIVRGQTLSLKQKEFIEAARAAGLPRRSIIARHIVPNLLGPVVVYVTLTIPAVILAESFLSFLGMGVQEPLTSLGSLISIGNDEMDLAPWMLS